MKVSTKGRYGLRALVDLAAYSKEGTIPLSEIAKRQNLSLNYLEQMFGTLRRAGIVKSMKGPSGGYMLARDASEITVEEVLTALEGRFSIVTQNAKGEMDEVQMAIQNLVWNPIDEKIRETTASQTIGDLAAAYREAKDEA